MSCRERKSLCSILDESPFFTELSVGERESLVRELLESYPHLIQDTNSDMKVSYEAGQLRQSY
jgi:hypothetical protein